MIVCLNLSTFVFVGTVVRDRSAIRYSVGLRPDASVLEESVGAAA